MAPRRSYYCPKHFREDLLANRAAVIRRVTAVVASFNPNGRGQPVKAHPAELAVRLGYKEYLDPAKRKGLTIVGVVTRLVVEMVEGFLRAVPRPSHTRWYRIVRDFDGVQPRGVGRSLRCVSEAFTAQWPSSRDTDGMDCDFG